MKKGGLKEKSPLVFGRGIIIVAILIPATLSFILGYFVGKSITKESPEMKQLQEIQSDTVQPLETQSQQQSQSQVSEPAAGKELQPTESQNKAAKESQKAQKPVATLYTVQVGAFKNVADADALKKKLEKKGYRNGRRHQGTGPLLLEPASGAVLDRRDPQERQVQGPLRPAPPAPDAQKAG